LTIVNPRVGRETSDCGESAATEEETRSSIAVRGEKANLSSGRRKTKEELNVRISLGSVHHSSSRLVEPVREVDEPMSSLDERDLVVPQNRGKNRSEVVTLRDHLRRNRCIVSEAAGLKWEKETYISIENGDEIRWPFHSKRAGFHHSEIDRIRLVIEPIVLLILLFRRGRRRGEKELLLATLVVFRIDRCGGRREVIELSAVIREMGTRLSGGVLGERGRERGGTGGIENHDSETVRRVIHRCGSDSAVEDL